MFFNDTDALEEKEDYRQINVMRYMGNKNKLLKFIVPKIIEETKKGEIIFDLMAGTHSISYALKERNQIFSNDILSSSYIIGKALIENNNELNYQEIEKVLKEGYEDNIHNKYYNFFEKYYSDTYFSYYQCVDIDSIRYAIDKIKGNGFKKDICLTALIYAMCYAQSTPGHFAQFMPKTHPRIKKLRKLNIWDAFIKKLYELITTIYISNYKNKVFNLDYREFFNNDIYKKLISSVKLFYIDPPYTGEQYSRFYHILETVVKYDHPILSHKGLYRNNRIMSNFSYRPKVFAEFKYLIRNISNIKKSKAAISYSNKGLISIEELTQICNMYFNSVNVEKKIYPHSTQGKGNINNIIEYLIICKN